MKEKIIEVISTLNGKITFDGLTKKTGIEKEILKRLLLELKLDGKILESSRKFSLSINFENSYTSPSISSNPKIWFVFKIFFILL